MSDLIVFDTSVIIDQIRGERHSDRIRKLTGIVRTCSVVIAELWRGASSPVDRKIVSGLEQNLRVLSPTTENWFDSGKILAKMRGDLGLQPQKLRDLHFDVLIALTVRNYGATLITTNRTDFELIRGYRDFKLEVW
jgi:predicted nucleic acid-binding protein